MKVEISECEWLVIVGALRHQEEGHKRNGFDILVLELQELRSRLNDAYIDKNLSVG
jgi:hypothetical protein